MTKRQLVFVSFEPTAHGFRGLLSVRDFANSGCDLEPQVECAAGIYTKYTHRMREIVDEIDRIRRGRRRVSARKVWEVGDCVFDLAKQLGELGLQIDGLYAHLARDLGIKRKWLEKVVTLRRYVQQQDVIPPSSCWGQFEKGTRKAAEALAEGFNQR